MVVFTVAAERSHAMVEQAKGSGRRYTGFVKCVGGVYPLLHTTRWPTSVHMHSREFRTVGGHGEARERYRVAT